MSDYNLKFKETVGVVEVSGPHGEYVIFPGQDLTGQPEIVRAFCAKHQTPGVIANFEERVSNDPVLNPILAPRRVGTPREFLHLFTNEEKAAFFTAKSQNVELELWWAEASTGDFSLDHPSVALGLGGLAQAGILAPARVEEILGADFNAV